MMENLQSLERLQVSEKDLIRSICKQSFFHYVKEFWDIIIPETPHWNWHIEFLCHEAQNLCERIFANKPKEHDEVVNISPGTTKSSIWSIFLPTWAWTRMPSFRFIGASYAFPLAMDLSRKARQIVHSEKYTSLFPEVRLQDDQDAKHYFATDKGGYRYAVGVNGSVMGMHAHLIVIDDPLDPNEAVSELDLAAANRWIKETLSSRKVDKAVTPMVLVMQRLHQDDPTALFLAKKNVRHICIPAEECDFINPPSLRKFYQDGLMDPIRLPRLVLEEARENGELFYSAQYMQNPAPPGGAMFKVSKLKAGTPPRRFVRLARYWDKAGTAGGKGAFTVGTKMGIDQDKRFWVLDVIRVRLDSFEREELIKKTANEDGYNCWVGVEQEPGSGGKQSAEETIRSLHGFITRAHKVDASTGGKERRADPWSVQVNAGNVYLPIDLKVSETQWQGWAKEWVEEHRFFPNSRYKDQVDSASGAFMMCHKRRIRIGGITPTTPGNW